MVNAHLDITQEAVDGFLDMKDFSIEDAARFIKLYPLLSTILRYHACMLAEHLDIRENQVFAVVFSTAKVVIDLLERSNPPNCMDAGGN